MTNQQARMIASAVALFAGVAATATDNLSVNVGLAIILMSGAALVAEYVRSFR